MTLLLVLLDRLADDDEEVILVNMARRDVGPLMLLEEVTEEVFEPSTAEGSGLRFIQGCLSAASGFNLRYRRSVSLTLLSMNLLRNSPLVWIPVQTLCQEVEEELIVAIQCRTQRLCTWSPSSALAVDYRSGCTSRVKEQLLA